MVPPVCPWADEESPPPKDAHLKSSDEDTYTPSDEVAPDPPTLDWFWGQYDLCLWKSLPPAEKAGQVAFKKDMAEEDARYQAACEAHDAAWKKEAAELLGADALPCGGGVRRSVLREEGHRRWAPHCCVEVDR